MGIVSEVFGLDIRSTGFDPDLSNPEETQFLVALSRLQAAQAASNFVTLARGETPLRKDVDEAVTRGFKTVAAGGLYYLREGRKDKTANVLQWLNKAAAESEKITTERWGQTNELRRLQRLPKEGKLFFFLATMGRFADLRRHDSALDFLLKEVEADLERAIESGNRSKEVEMWTLLSSMRETEPELLAAAIGLVRS